MPVDKKAQIGKSLFNVEWLLNKLNEKCDEYRKLSKSTPLKHVDVSVISEGMGYMSTVYKCILEFEGGQKLGYCLKVPSADKIAAILSSESMKKELIKIHDRECQFYETFKDLKKLKLPKIYSTCKIGGENTDSQEAHILMEFLGDDCGTLPLDESLTRQQLINVAEQFAYLHAYIQANPNIINPKDFVPFGAEGFGEDKDGKKADFQPENMSNKIKEAMERHGDVGLLQAIADLNPIGNDPKFYIYTQMKSHLDVGMKPVFCHGDLWGNNILFKKDPKTGKFTDEIAGIIDWQVSSCSNQSQDLVRLLTFNTSTELRRELTTKIHEIYYEKLTEELAKHNLKPDFTIDQLIEASKPAFLNQIMFSMFLAAFHFQRPEQENERKVFMERLKQSALDAGPLVKEYADKWKL